jgi:hypothetical protein
VVVRIVGVSLALGAWLTSGCGSSARDQGAKGLGPSEAAGGQPFAGTGGDGLGGTGGFSGGLGAGRGGAGAESGDVGQPSGGADAGEPSAGRLSSTGGVGSTGVGGTGGAAGTAGVSGGFAAGRAGAGAESGADGQAGRGAGAAGAAGAAAFPPRPLCGGSVSAGNEAWCTGIENVVLSKGTLTDASGDGNVSPGEEASVVIVMRNDGADDYNFPCVGLLADNPAVTIIGGEARDNPAWNFFGIGGGQSLEVTMSFRCGESIAPGTTVHFVAWLDVLKAGCTNGNEIEFDVEIE